LLYFEQFPSFVRGSEMGRSMAAKVLGAVTMSSNVVRKPTSIIVPAWNQLELTQRCFAALEEHTRPSWELIAINKGSTDGPAAYLAGVRDMVSVPVTVITNTKKVGFPAEVNQGLWLARRIGQVAATCQPRRTSLRHHGLCGLPWLTGLLSRHYATPESYSGYIESPNFGRLCRLLSRHDAKI
jgi:hypothetical protein